MWTGRETLSSIESAIAKLHGEESQLDGALRSAVGDAERLRKERGDALRELARVKLDEMAAGRLVRDLDAGERRAAQILDDYRLRMAAATAQREALLKEIAGAESERHDAAAAVEAALAAVDGLRAQVEATLQAKQDWRDAKAVRDAVDAVAAEAEKKATASEAELGAKKKPYDGDPLFAYLWGRRFGTSEYHSAGFARAMDRVVARFVGFDDARPNYAALIEIPLRLREHATSQRAAVEQPQAALSAIEREAMVAAGMEAKEKVLAEARHKLAGLDATVEQKHEQLKKIDEARASLVSGDSNPAYNEALTTIATADGKDDVATLYAEARRTATTADEAVVRRIETIDATVAKTEGEVADLRKAMVDLSSRRADVESLRDRFRRNGYDHPQSSFENEGAIGSALSNVLEGVVRSGVLWDLLRQGYRTRPTLGRPDFGSHSFPFPFPVPGGTFGGSRGDDWREPSSRGGWSPGGGGGGGDGGSSSGGSDGGGDFSTGGSF
jgi:chromosome segregation ATPase